MRKDRKARGRRASGPGARLAAIRDLLESGRIHSQQELASRLRRRGFRVTQATLSRDLRGLGVARRPDPSGGSVYGLPDARRPGERAVRAALAGFLDMGFSGNLAVAKTLPGHAGSVAAAFDAAGIEGLLGSVAGDDTILLVAADGVSRTAFRKAIVARLPELAGRIV